MKVFAFIPARGGSTRIPRKNLQHVGAESLVDRTLRCARNAFAPGQLPHEACYRMTRGIVLSTDDDEIARCADGWGAEVHRRPSHLAGEHSQIEEALGHWMRRATPTLDDEDVIVLLQPTSPFRRPDTIAACVALVRQGFDTALTITLECRRSGRLRSHFDPVTKRDIADRVIWDHPIEHRPRSQDAQRRPYENGCVYAFSAGHFRRTALRMGGREACVITTWLEAFEIDTPDELEAARALASVGDRGLR